VGSSPALPSAYDDSAWFRRFRFATDDLIQVHSDVARMRTALGRGTLPTREELATRVELGAMLFPLGHESEAELVLAPAAALARTLGDHDRLIAALLNLATTQQYLGRHAEALGLFEQALARVQANDTDEHYVLHHRGRCLAEVGDVEAARTSFDRALDLRRALDVAWMVTSTQTALAELDAWCAARRAR
jgi:tetratricopeptide (TPR) repeat protein